MPDTRIRLLTLVLTLFLLPAAALRAADGFDVDNPPQGLFSDEWAEIFLQGQKIGYAHSTMQRKGDRISVAVDMKIKIDRANVTIAMTVTQRTVETVAGKPLEFENHMDMSNVPSGMRGKIRDGEVEIVTSQLGMETRKSFSFPDTAVMLWGAYRETMKRGFAPDTRYTIPVYSPDLRLDGTVDAEYRVIGPDSFLYKGRKIGGVKVVSTVEIAMGKIESSSWVRPEDGVVLKSTIPMAGLTMEMIACDEQTALADYVSPEFFMSNTVPAGRKLVPKDLERVQYRLSLTDPEATMPDIVETGMQTVVGRRGGVVELQVTRQNHAAIAAAEAVGATVGEEYLGSNIVMKLDDPELIKLAQRAAGDAQAPMEVAANLREFVTDYINDKSLNVGFATASEICRTREGDCSEHAVLLAALGRIHKLPARVAVGLAYVPRFGDQSDIFGFHMWTQFFIGGQWVDFDAALRETECSPTRICFSTNSLHDSGLVELSFALMEVIGRIKLEIVEVANRN